jgi:hypothetical protein
LNDYCAGRNLPGELWVLIEQEQAELRGQIEQGKDHKTHPIKPPTVVKSSSISYATNDLKNEPTKKTKYACTIKKKTEPTTFIQPSSQQQKGISSKRNTDVVHNPPFTILNQGIQVQGW